MHQLTWTYVGPEWLKHHRNATTAAKTEICGIFKTALIHFGLKQTGKTNNPDMSSSYKVVLVIASLASKLGIIYLYIHPSIHPSIKESDISLRSWLRHETGLKESVYLTRNIPPNERLRRSLPAGHVPKQLSSRKFTISLKGDDICCVRCCFLLPLNGENNQCVWAGVCVSGED